jgi:hypothetical protein
MQLNQYSRNNTMNLKKEFSNFRTTNNLSAMIKATRLFLIEPDTFLALFFIIFISCIIPMVFMPKNSPLYALCSFVTVASFLIIISIATLESLYRIFSFSLIKSKFRILPILRNRIKKDILINNAKLDLIKFILNEKNQIFLTLISQEILSRLKSVPEDYYKNESDPHNPYYNTRNLAESLSTINYNFISEIKQFQKYLDSYQMTKDLTNNKYQEINKLIDSFSTFIYRIQSSINILESKNQLQDVFSIQIDTTNEDFFNKIKTLENNQTYQNNLDLINEFKEHYHPTNYQERL